MLSSSFTEDDTKYFSKGTDGILLCRIIRYRIFMPFLMLQNVRMLRLLSFLSRLTVQKKFPSFDIIYHRSHGKTTVLFNFWISNSISYRRALAQRGTKKLPEEFTSNHKNVVLDSVGSRFTSSNNGFGSVRTKSSLIYFIDFVLLFRTQESRDETVSAANSLNAPSKNVKWPGL